VKIVHTLAWAVFAGSIVALRDDAPKNGTVNLSIPVEPAAVDEVISQLGSMPTEAGRKADLKRAAWQCHRIARCARRSAGLIRCAAFPQGGRQAMKDHGLRD
jgi:hypothetical protein